METKLKIYSTIQELSKSIRKNEKFDAAINMHCDLMLNEFQNKRLFYKFIFSNNRFIISTVTASVFYSNEEPYLSDVKNECLKTGLVTPNTISSLLVLFKASGRISLIESLSDRRKKTFIINSKGLEDILALINTMVPAVKIMFSSPMASDVLNKSHLPAFFKEYATIHKSSIFLVDLVKKSNIFITKDSGHMILICLYMMGLSKNKKRETMSSLANKCAVSRSHLRGIVFEAEKNGLLKFNSLENTIYLYEGFTNMFLQYMSYYFSFIQLGLEEVYTETIWQN